LLFDFDSYRASAGELPDDLGAYSHIFISGSTASVLDNVDWIHAEQELIRTAVAQGKVIMGSCFGHQIIARALFGDGAVRKRPSLDVGWPEIEILADDALLGAAGSKIYSHVFHYDDVCQIDERNATVIQPHFEMGIVEGLKFIEWVKGNGIPDRSTLINSVENYPQDSGRIIPLMKAYHTARPL